MSNFLNVFSNQWSINDPVPVWFMRQAGRYLPEYRELRADMGGFMELVFDPENAAEVTLQPIRRFGMDAAILFSDILVTPHACGQTVTFVKGEGPRLPPLKTRADIDALDYDPTVLQSIGDTIRHVRAELNQANKTSLIGFAGSPFTVACYMVDGRGKTGFKQTLNKVHNDPEFIDAIVDKLVTATIDYLMMQVESGAQALQLFDSWSGLLKTRMEFDRFVIQPTQRIIEGVRAQYPTIPIIGFPRDSIDFIGPYTAHTGIKGVGISQDMDWDTVLKNVPDDIVLQGNLDPNLLLNGGNAMIVAARNICDRLHGRRFVFNLGHGVIKETPPHHVATLVNTIHQWNETL